MKTGFAFCMGLALAGWMSAGADVDPHLVAHYAFDDPAAPLAATVGADAAVVNYTKAGGVSVAAAYATSVRADGVYVLPAGLSVLVR